MRFVFATLLGAGALALAAAASAQEEPTSPALEEARQRFDLGNRHSAQGDWALALVEWERAHAILEAEHHPRASYVLYNIARANEELGRTGEAIESYETFLAATQNDPGAPNRADAERHMRDLRVRLQLRGEGSRGFSPFVPGIVVAGLGAAAVLAGGIVGGVALAQGEEAQAGCEGTRCTPAAHARIGEAQLLANVADGLLWGGLAVLATGVVLTVALGEEDSVRVNAGCTRDDCLVVIRGSF